MIYCVVPRELADELYEKMVARYEGSPNVTVIVDRRTHDRRRDSSYGGKRLQRDRRRARIPGTFLETPASAA